MSETEHEPEYPDEQLEAQPPYDETDEEEEAAEHETAAEGGPSEADEQPEPASEANVDERFTKLGRSATTWRNRISAVLGEDAQHLIACELCDPDIPGFHWPADLEATRPRDETHAKLLEVLLAPEGPDYLPAPHAVTCETCGGFGNVLSGSKMPQHALVSCPGCKGLGYKATGSGTSNGAALEQAELAPVAVGGEPMVLEDTDPWGSPKLLADGQHNPNYGRMPQYKDGTLPQTMSTSLDLKFWAIVLVSYGPRELVKLRWLAFEMDKPRDPREAL